MLTFLTSKREDTQDNWLRLILKKTITILRAKNQSFCECLVPM